MRREERYPIGKGELYLHIVPVLLGAGERLLENVGDPALNLVEVIASTRVTHVKLRVVRQEVGVARGQHPRADTAAGCPGRRDPSATPPR